MNPETRNEVAPTLRVIPREQHSISRKNISKAALRVLYRLHDAGFAAYLVGGAVRDLLLGGHPKDFDVATNALIITAPPKIMKSLMAVIDKLDIRRAQVKVEAIIVEIDVNKSSSLGVQWLLDGGTGAGFGVINLPGSGTSIVDLAAAVAGATGSAGTLPSTGTTTGITSATVGTEEGAKPVRLASASGS